MRIICLIHKAWQMLVSKGPKAVVRAAAEYVSDQYHSWLDGRLDRRYGIDTCGLEYDLVGLGASGEHQAHGHAYEPIQISVFGDIVQALPISPNGYCFIDFGSGKGRALILAAEAGFKRMIGIEFATALHVAAQHNIASYQQTRSDSAPIETHCQDAAKFAIPTCDAVLFFYNPFDDVVMRSVLTRIESSWRAHPRDLIVVYRNPVYVDILDSARFIRKIVAHHAYCIYRTVT